MKLSKIIFVLSIIFILALPKARNYAFSLVQSVVVESGVVNVSDSNKDHGKFDFNFRLRDLSGNEIDAKRFEGKVILINIWATWCGPCRAEMPSIQKLYEKLDHDKFSFIMLSADEPFYIEKVKSFVKNNDFTFPVYLPVGGLTEQLKVPTIPTTFVVDKNGMIVKQETGMRNYDTKKFKAFLESLAK